MRNILAVLLFSIIATQSSAVTSEVFRVKMQEVTPVELKDTVLESGESVIVRGQDNSRGTVTIHVGDGQTSGGVIVSDPFSLKAPYQRQLLRSEYTIAPYGNAVYSNGVWELITPRSGASYSAVNTGGVVIASSYAISRVDADDTSSNSGFTGDILNDTAYTVRTNFVVNGYEENAMYMETTTFRAAFSNLAVYAWVGSNLLGMTNNAIGTTMLVDTPVHESAAIPLGWWLSQMSGRYGEDWSSFSARSTVDLAYQDLKMSPYLSCVSTGNTGSVVWRRNFLDGSTRDLMTLSTTNKEFHIATYEGTTTSVVVRIDASIPFAAAPVIQMTSNLTNIAWINLATTSDWPASTWYTVGGVRKWRVFTLTAVKPSSSTAFFRVQGTATNTVEEALLLEVPLHVIGNATISGISKIILPTSTNGLTSGILWNDSGTVKVMP